jgi:hypothetical protein
MADTQCGSVWWTSTTIKVLDTCIIIYCGIIVNIYLICLWEEEGKPTQWPQENGQLDKQLSTNPMQKAKDQATRTPLKLEGELMFSGSVSSSFYTSGTSRVTLVTNPVQLMWYTRHDILDILLKLEWITSQSILYYKDIYEMFVHN